MHLKYLKYLAFVLGGLSTVLVAGALYLHLTFDGARLAVDASQYVKQRYQRVLHFDGPLALSMFPRLELRLPATTLSAHGDDGEFLGVDAATVSIELWPLLSRRVVVEQIELAGLRLALQKNRDGSTNADDLLAPGETAAAPLDVDIARLAVRDGRLSWRDEARGQSLRVDGLNLATGRLAAQAGGRVALEGHLVSTAPAADLSLKLDGDYHLQPARQALQLLRVSFHGRLGDQPGLGGEATINDLQRSAGGALRVDGVKLEARASRGDDALKLAAALPHLDLGGNRADGWDVPGAEGSVHIDGKGHAGTLKAQLGAVHAQGGGIDLATLAVDVDWHGADGDLRGEAHGAGHWQGGTQTIELPAVGGAFELKRPGRAPLKLALAASARGELAQGSAAGRLQLRTDDSQLKGSWSVPRFAPLAVGFDLDIDRCDLDRLLSARPAAEPAPSPEQREARVDLRALTGLDVDGQLRFASLHAGGLRLEKVRLPVAVHDGKLVSRGHSANLYGGSLSGTLNLAADGPRIAYAGSLASVNLGPLLHDLGVKDALSGLASLSVDLSSGGERIDTLRRKLAGSGRFSLHAGKLSGIDMGVAMREWHGAIHSRQAARRSYRQAESTAFSDLAASFRIDGGIVHNTDLQAKSPMLRVTGGGELDLAQSTIDYLSYVTLMVIPVGPDSGLLATLRGLTVALRIKGPLDNPGWLLEPPGGHLVMQGGRAVVHGLGALLPSLPKAAAAR